MQFRLAFFVFISALFLSVPYSAQGAIVIPPDQEPENCNAEFSEPARVATNRMSFSFPWLHRYGIVDHGIELNWATDAQVGEGCVEYDHSFQPPLQMDIFVSQSKHTIQISNSTFSRGTTILSR